MPVNDTPTLERFALLKLHEHQPLPPGYTCVAHGGGAFVWSHLQDTKAQHALIARARVAEQIIRRADQIRADRVQAAELPAIVQAGIDRLAKAEARMAALEAMNAKLEAKIREYEQREARQRIDAAIAELQGPDEHRPTADLHVLAAKDAEIPYPSLRRPQDEDEPGGELGGATDPVVDPSELSHPFVPRFRTPAAVSLGRADDIRDWRFRP